MSKGDDTRQAILDKAIVLASTIGLEGVTIGRLAEDLSLSKSGLFAHFGSKEALQIAVVEAARDRFVDEVVRPAMKAPRGEPRVRAMFDHWLSWGIELNRAGGCFFVAAAFELDDRPGPVRDALARSQRDWMDMLAGAARMAVSEKHFRADLDPEQFAFTTYGIMLAAHHASRLLNDRKAARRARAAFEDILRSARATN